MANTIQVRRGTQALLPILAAGELGFSTDVRRLHIGDGAANHEILLKNAFDANTFLYAATDNAPTTRTPTDVMGLLSNAATADFSLAGRKLTNLAGPAVTGDAANKGYVDSVAQGLRISPSVACATTANIITLSGERTIDGVLTATSRVLVKDQTDAKNNGIYVTAAGAWARATDFDSTDEIPSTFVFVEGGTANGSTGWVCTNEPENSVLTVDNITFAQFSAAGFVDAGAGLAKVGNTIQATGVLETLSPLTPAANQLPFFSTPNTVGAKDIVTVVGTPGADTNIPTEKAVRDAMVAGVTTFAGLTDTPANYTAAAGEVVRVNATANALEFVPFAATFLDNTPALNETGKGVTSGWAFGHDAAATGVHGAGVNTLLHTASAIDGGVF